MKNSFKLLLFTVFPLILSFILSQLSEDSFFMFLLNILFWVSMVLLMIGASLFVIQGGFFTGMVTSNKRLTKKTVKMEDFISQYEEASEFIRPAHPHITRRLLLAGGILFFITLITSFIFYNQ